MQYIRKIHAESQQNRRAHFSLALFGLSMSRCSIIVRDERKKKIGTLHTDTTVKPDLVWSTYIKRLKNGKWLIRLSPALLQSKYYEQ